ncbi:unnamed protein product [Darwinula stevensoni]|uniref:Uncharacterized protein n=1 Tax=Darwinula stevensoni TaxID=69355 RepID=A0A7R9A284_9CRUS|nr:unnamed protein product [Darwinula stevensoni]CAG0888202.1 unnamed protein product [Darwinula stevensoni]
MEVEEEESSSSSSEYLRSRSEFLSHLHLRPKTDDQVQEERPRTHFTRSCNRGELPETEESPGNPRNESPIRNEELYLQAELDQESWRILDLKCSDRPPDPPLGFTTKLKLRKTARGWQAEGINSEDNNSGARKLRRKWFKKRKRWKEEKKLKRILGSSHRHRRHHRDRDREGSSEKSAKDEETKTRNREEEVDSGNATVNANATEAKVSLPQFQKGATRKFDRPVAIVHARRSSPDRPPSSSVTCDTPPICGDEESDHQSTESTTDSLLKSILETNPSSSEGRSILQDLLAKPPPLKTEGEGSDESTLLVPRTLLPALLSCPHLYLDEVVSCQAALVSQAAQNPNLLLQGALMMLPQEVFPHLLKDGTGVLQTMLKASDPVHCISSFTQDSGGSVVYRPSREPDKYSILKSFLRNDHEEEKPAEIRVKSGQELFQTSPPRHWESLSGTGGKGEKVKRKRFHLDAIVDNLKRRRQLQEDEEFGRNSGIDPGTAMRLRHKILSARVPALIPLSAFHAKDDK